MWASVPIGKNTSRANASPLGGAAGSMRRTSLPLDRQTIPNGAPALWQRLIMSR